ncbi:MAG: motility associated factor glycosyltransferase family protein, partial [Phycisphaerales bacterium]
LGSGTVFLAHPPSAPRLGASAGEFERTFANVLRAVRTAVVTTMIQVETTVRNLLQNAGPYALCPGIEDLTGVCAGTPAVVVSAGPSLSRNLALLADPDLRGRVVVIAVQTVLKTMLARGIRPDFVTALDHHEISRRFYEGLTRTDVEGVTLVCEAKANPAIVDAFPGAVRFVGDQVLDDVLGDAIARQMGRLKPGATVAHLAYYFARHLGCDPVILIGQDLGFTDNQYYAPGAAIHHVWSGELNEFNTLEMLEWQRIARMKSMLRRVPAQLGGQIYTDEQMATYQVQFERDFLEDTRRGLRVIDATEGGTLKRHTEVCTLREALSAAPARAHAVPATPARLDDSRLRAVSARVRSLRADVESLERISGDTAAALTKMLEHHGNDAVVNRLIESVHRNAARVAELGAAHRLVQFINQTGQLNRFRSDRLLMLDDSLAPRERQRMQIERDLTNVRWLGEAAAHAKGLLDDCERSLDGAPKVTRDSDALPESSAQVAAPRRVVAAVTVDLARGGLCTPRDALAPLNDGTTPLDRVVRALRDCDGIDAVLLICRDSDAVRTLLSAHDGVSFAPGTPELWAARDRHAASVGAARALARHCWRGGIGNLTCYDEAFYAPLVAEAIKSEACDAAVIVGADWSMLDAALLDATVARYRENPARHPLAFSQAPPGAGACVISAELVRELTSAGGLTGTIGFLLGYHPFAPQADPIAKPQCVQVDAPLRDCLVRHIPDSTARLAAKHAVPTSLLIDLSPTGRAPLSVHLYARLFAGWAQTIEDGAVSIRATGADPLLARVLVQTALGAGVPHVYLRAGADAPDELLSAGADAVSFDCGTDASEPTARALLERIERLQPRDRARLPACWYVPHLTRCDASLEGIEDWYDYWLRVHGVAVIEPLAAPVPGARITPLPTPANVSDHVGTARLVVSRCGLVSRAAEPVGNLARETILDVLERLGVPACEGGLAASETSRPAGSAA